MIRRTYKKPPIQEVICDIIVEQDTTWDLTLPGVLYERVKREFPIHERRVVQEVEVQQGTSGSALNIKQGERAVFIAEDRRRLIQVGERRLTVNQLPPYPGWKQFRKSIEDAYGALEQVTNVKSLRQLSLRYVDRVVIPGVKVKIEDYFRFRPHFEGIQAESPMDLWVAFFVGIQIPYDELRDLLRIQLGFGSPEKDMSVFILETEHRLVRSGEFDAGQILEWLDAAHERIGEAFEMAITDKLRALFQPE